MSDWTDKKEPENKCGTDECTGPFTEQQYHLFSFIVGIFTFAACFISPTLLLIGLCEMVVVKMGHWYYYNNHRSLFWAGAYLLLVAGMAFVSQFPHVAQG